MNSRYLRPQDLARYKDFQFATKLIVEGFYAGRHRSPFADTAAEFADYRPYVPGDEIRSVDWRASARSDRDYVRLSRKETDMPCYLLLDSSGSMNFQDAAADRPKGEKRKTPNAETGLTKFVYAAYLAAAIAYLTIQQGDKTGLAFGGEKLTAFLPPGGTRTHLLALLNTLERARPEGQTRLADNLTTLFGRTKRRGLLVVLSDFLEDPDALFQALAAFRHRGDHVLLFHILTETEQELSGDGLSRYHDPESTAFLEAPSESLRDAYRQELQHWFTNLENRARRQRIAYHRVTTTTPYTKTLETYLSVRASGVGR